MLTRDKVKNASLLDYNHVTNSAATFRMEIQHVATYYFLRTINSRGSQGFVGQSSRNVALRVEQPSVLNKFFSELQYSAAFGCESRKFAGGSENIPNFVIFWPTL